MGKPRLVLPLCAFLTLAWLAVACLALPGLPLRGLPAATIAIGGQPVRLLLATTPEQHQTGLMFRESMAEDEGMLFVYDAPKTRCMWMKNTLIPLTAAFLDESGRILNLADMDPLTTRSHCSEGPVLYVLEMNRGWFARHGIREGGRIDLSDIDSAR